MSTIKTILAPVSEAEDAAIPLDAAFQLARTFAAHVTVLHVRPDPTSAVPLIGEGMSGAMVEEMLGIADQQGRAAAAAAHAVFDAVRGHHGIAVEATPPALGATTAWVESVGREEEILAHKGRVHDLVVLGHAGAADVTGMALNAALLDSGKPVLLAPATLPARIGRNAVVAWNGSAEAGRAVAAALPFLEQAETVTILTINEDGEALACGKDVVALLAWHGVKAIHTDIPAGGNAGAALLAFCRDADLLVMGAYTHSRLRQLILGGVTRHVLTHAPIPVLLSH